MPPWGQTLCCTLKEADSSFLRIMSINAPLEIYERDRQRERRQISSSATINRARALSVRQSVTEWSEVNASVAVGGFHM